MKILRYLRQDRQVIWINLTVSLVRDSQREPDYFISVVEDISDRHQLKYSLEQSLWRLSNLHRIDRAILEVKDPHEIAQTAIDRIEKIFHYQRISIVTFDYERKIASVLASEGLAAKSASDRQVNNEHGAMLMIIDSFKPILDFTA